MISKLYKNIVKAFFIFTCLLSQDMDQDSPNLFPVELSVFEGYQSLLLNWSFNDSIVPQKVPINTRKSSDQEFYPLQEIGG